MTETRRCAVCPVPVDKPWHTLCRECYAWHLAGLHLQRFVRLTRLVQERTP